MKALIDQLRLKEHGFRHISEAGSTLLKDDKLRHLEIAMGLLNDDSYQARMLAVFILGRLSIKEPKALKILKTQVASDENWRVQEMLAKAFDHYCKIKGYRDALSTIEAWLSDRHANVKRAVVEGLRIWTGRPYFKDHPEAAIELISRHRSDHSTYLRKSVGNALRDIGRNHPMLIKKEISGWDLTNENIQFTYRLVTKNK